MTLANEEKLLRRWVDQQRPFGRGHTYTPSLRRRILIFVDLARAAGISEAECCKSIGVSKTSVTAWRRMEPIPTEPPDDEPSLKALVPVEVTPSTIQLGGAITFVTPSGYRVEGLTVDQAAALLREFL